MTALGDAERDIRAGFRSVLQLDSFTSTAPPVSPTECSNGRASPLRSSPSPQSARNPLSDVHTHLRAMGYDLTHHGAAVALFSLESGYNAVETASNIALTTFALDMREAGNNLDRVASYVPHAMALLEVLTEYKDRGAMRPEVWRNDASALFRIAQLGPEQQLLVDEILSDPVSGKKRLATSRLK